MPITAKWNNKSKTYIFCNVKDPWFVHELLEARKAWYRMIKSVDYRVPILLDLSESYELPTGALRHITAIHRTPHPRQGHVYVMGLTCKYERLFPHICHGVADADKSFRIIDSPESIVCP